MVWELIKSLIFGIVEGITEWLPISSTGHLILLDEFLKLDATDNFKEMFDVVIQLGAILAVVVIYWKKLWPFGKQDNHGTDRLRGMPEKGHSPDVVQGHRGNGAGGSDRASAGRLESGTSVQCVDSCHHADPVWYRVYLDRKVA